VQIARTLPQQRGTWPTCNNQLNCFKLCAAVGLKNCIAKSNLGCSQFLYVFPFPTLSCLLFSISLAQFFWLSG